MLMKDQAVKHNAGSGILSKGAEEALPTYNDSGAPLGSPLWKPDPPVSVDDIIDAVCRRFSVKRSDLLSNGRSRRLARARALVAWHATRGNICTLTEVGKRLDRNPGTLYAVCKRYRKTERRLFAESLQEFLTGPLEQAASEALRSNRSAPRGKQMLKMRAAILHDPAVMGGMPVLAGTRVPLQVLFGYLQDGASLVEFLRDFPRVPKDLVVDALKLAEAITLAAVSTGKRRTRRSAVKRAPPHRARARFAVSLVGALRKMQRTSGRNRHH